MTAAERVELRNEVEAWFFVPDDGPTSLEKCCAVIGELDVDAVRDQAWRQIGTADFKGARRRPRLGEKARAAILRALARGASSITLGEQYGVNDATVRKIRIQARRDAAVAA